MLLIKAYLNDKYIRSKGYFTVVILRLLSFVINRSKMGFINPSEKGTAGMYFLKFVSVSADK